MLTNGNKGRLRYPTQAPGTRQLAGWYFSSASRRISVQGGYSACFCRHGTNFIEHYACRDTSLTGAKKLSRYRIFIGGTGAVSRHKLSRSQKFVKVQDFNCDHMRALSTEAERRWVSGCNGHYEFVSEAVAKAKSVTSNLPITAVRVRYS
jgi:hypothetical protein